MPHNTEILNTPIPEVNDLIGRPPSWLLRSGISMITLVTIIVLFMTYLIKYPDKIQGTGSLTSSSPPIELISQAQGYIGHLFVSEGDEVAESDRLFYIRNTTNPLQIELLTSWIDQYEAITDPIYYLSLEMPRDLQLGSIQNDYASLYLKFNELRQTLKYSMPFQQIDNLSEEIKKIAHLNQSQRREKNIYKDELALEEADFRRYESLQKGGVISQQEKEQANTRFLQKQRQYESMENAIIQNNIRIEQLELEKLKIEGERTNLVNSYQFTINEIIARIRSNIEQWTQTYTITAPISGRVSLINRYHENASVKQGELLGYVLPTKSSRNFFISQVPIHNIGKVKMGQKVLIKLDAYPHKEHGMIRSTVTSISSLPQQSQEGIYYYEVKVDVPDDLITDTGHQIPYKPNMTAQIEIITEDRTILGRIFNQVISLIKQQDL